MRKLDKRFLTYTITLFTAYDSVDEKNESFQNYKNFFAPTIIENVYYEEASNFQATKSGLRDIGDFSLIISMKQSKFYRYIDDEKKEIEYIDFTEFKTKGFDEQENRYFTIKPSSSGFILGIIENYKDNLKIDNKKLNNDALKYAGKLYHKITKVDRVGLSGDINKSFIISLTGTV